MKNPLVSIIIPTYNWKKEWISLAIESVLSQTYKNFELIIINDASTNTVEKTILEYKTLDSRIEYIKNHINLERSISKNKWILAGKWEYIAFLDDDDLWADDTKLDKQVRFLEDHADCWLCWCSVHIMNEYWVIEKKNPMRETDEEIRNHLMQFNQLAQSAVIVRKEVFAFSGLFLDKFIPSEDAELWLRISKYTKVHNLQNTYIEYRNRIWNSSNMNRSKQQWYGFKAMWIHRRSYPNLVKACFLRIGYFVLTLFWYSFK